MYLRSVEILKKEGYDSKGYPFSIPALKELNVLAFESNVTFLVGENGSGKSTLLEAIAYQCGFNSAGGGRNNNYDVAASQSILGNHLRLSWLPKITNGFFLRAETFYHFASHLDTIPESLQSYGGRPCMNSHMARLFSHYSHIGLEKSLRVMDDLSSYDPGGFSNCICYF